jgi:chemotaxis regulatin CheY-phosphate phosphatase CheZ
MPPRARTATTTTTTTTTTAPGLIDIRNTEEVSATVESFQQHFMVLSQYLAIMAVKLDFRIVGQLKKEGLDSHGRLSFLLGTSAQRAADRTTDPVNAAADALAEAAAAMILFGQRWSANVAEPIAAARNQQSELEADYLQI